jgi:hypothetical protein
VLRLMQINRNAPRSNNLYTKTLWRRGDAMHILDYVAIGVLIACMLAAVAMMLSRNK